VTPLLVVTGALVGAPLRLLATTIAARRGVDPAMGSLVVNVVGSALLGLLLGLAAVPEEILVLVGTGFCGTLTTFSAFGADVVRMVEARAVVRLLAYVVATLVLGLTAAAAGFWLAGSG
jgi:fluoride exporter